jgi:hypothetical protein
LLLRWALANHSIRVAIYISIVLALALLAATLPSASDGQGDGALANAAHRNAAHPHRPRALAGAPLAVPGESAPGPGQTGVTTAGTCRPVDRSSGYVNPLASAVVKPKRVDQGVDYVGTGTLRAIGAGTVTEVATDNTGWPGAFIEYQLTAGPAAGCYVFYAEGITAVSGLHVGQALRAGQPIATLIPDYTAGIEIGWGAGIGTETLAAQLGEWNSTDDQDSIPTMAGRSFSALVAALGGPPGKIGG